MNESYRVIQIWSLSSPMPVLEWPRPVERHRTGVRERASAQQWSTYGCITQIAIATVIEHSHHQSKGIGTGFVSREV